MRSQLREAKGTIRGRKVEAEKKREGKKKRERERKKEGRKREGIDGGFYSDQKGLGVRFFFVFTRVNR